MKHYIKYRLMFFCTLTAILILSCEGVTEETLAAKQINFIAPIDNLTTTSNTNTFAWESVDAAQRYQVQIVSPKFDSVIHFVVDSTITKTTFTYTLTTGIYQYRVRAINTSSQTNYFTRNITIQ